MPVLIFFYENRLLKKSPSHAFRFSEVCFFPLYLYPAKNLLLKKEKKGWCMKQLMTVWMLFVAITLKAQGYVDQENTKSLSDSQSGSLNDIEKLSWRVYEYKAFKKGDKKGPWSKLMNYIDSLPGARKELRREVIELANRVTGDKLKTGRRLVIPASFPVDYRAYSPYPFHYAAAGDLPKLFIIDKYTQTFGAYEYGTLVRWGLISAGRTDNLTPNGKFHFTWRAEYRQSTAAPPGEIWEMYWLVNFEPKAGIHVHQYALPIGAAASHGCVRVSLANAIWNYHWAEGNEDGKKGTPVWVINHNPVGRPAHWYITADGEVQSLVRLPENSTEVLANR